MSDEVERRQYWSSQLDLGYKMIEDLLAFPVEENGESFASLRDAVRDSGVEVWFSDSKIAGDLNRSFFLRESNVADVIRIAEVMNKRGWILKIEDAFRTLEMQRSLVRKPEVFDLVVEKCQWELGGAIPSVDLVARRSTVMVANFPKVGGHMSGSAIDISVYRKADGTEVNRGGSYLTVNETTPMRSPYIEKEDLSNRLAITEIMESFGFMHFPFEFWHYSKGDVTAQLINGKATPAPFGAVHWNAETNEVQAVDEPNAALNPLPEIEEMIHSALGRIAR